ncbi:cytochrome o ubiquinol oxidase subunit IV [Candidatus Saccharibacteria bacterium]|nr:cytochrome o ubiquinol oxidase subunit IV [Candidatus Saccharibacteria bacterium]
MSQSVMKIDRVTPNRRSYILGYSYSLLLTVASFFLVINNVFSGWITFMIISIFAIEQFIIQVIIFLHLGQEKKPRWNSAVFLYTIMTVLVLVLGTMWIMFNLDYNHHHNNEKSPSDAAGWISEEEGIYKR